MTVTEEFENEFKEFTGANHVITVCNGTAALHTALLSCGVQRGDKVVTSPFSFIASSNAILYCGATPVFADINSETYCLDPVETEQKLKNNNVKAILCVHLFGNVCDMNELSRISAEYRVPIIEDCCQALGRDVGNYGEFGCYSFYKSKNLWTFEGGMLTTKDSELAQKARMLINHGRTDHWVHEIVGYNYRMPEICALLGLQQLKRHKTAVLSELGVYGVEQGFYPYVIYDQLAYKQLGIKGNCPVAEKVAREVREHGSNRSTT